MPLAVYSAAEASTNLRSNRDSRWPDGRASEARLKGVAKVTLQPKFSFSTQDRIFTIGSCFAREIEKYLSELGFAVPALSIAIPAEERLSQTANDILNKYSVHSMENELRWAFKDPLPESERFFLQWGDGLWHDAQMVPNLKPASLERVIERRAMVTGLMRRIPECRVVVITLGLAEAWYDTANDLYLNGMPPQYALSAEPERFQLHVLDFEEIVQSLERIHQLLERHGHPDFKMLITVSPVPFKATFTGKDALIANTYSKAVQRAAAEAFARKHANVDYFPSFEIVTLSDRNIAYELDNIHVTRKTVAFIMSTVVGGYVTGANQQIDSVRPEGVAETRLAPSNKSTLLAKAKEAAAARDYEGAVAVYSSFLYRYGAALDTETEFEVRLNLGVAFLRAKLTKEGIKELAVAKKLSPDNPRATYKLGLGYARVKMDAEALDMFVQASRLNPREPDYHWRLGAQLIKLGRAAEGIEAARRALEIAPSHAGALEIMASA
jgi:tetratricopeptide (TPR) repeat protein